MGVRWDQKINEQVRETTGEKDIGYTIKKLNMNYAAHVARGKEEKYLGIILNWIPRYSKQQKVRLPIRWEDEIKREMRPIWQREAQNRTKWKVDVKAYAQQGVTVRRLAESSHF